MALKFQKYAMGHGAFHLQLKSLNPRKNFQKKKA